jgi:hypothetical protein
MSLIGGISHLESGSHVVASVKRLKRMNGMREINQVKEKGFGSKKPTIQRVKSDAVIAIAVATTKNTGDSGASILLAA